MPGFDLVFSSPKSLSYTWAIASPDLRAGIEQTLLESVTATVGKIEERAFIRTGRGGKNRQPCGLVVLLVMHFTARPVDGKRPDPQLHVHALVINTGVTADGKTAALHGVKFLNRSKSDQFALVFGTAFRREFARGIEALGFGIEPTLINGLEGWEIAGVPDLEIRRNSKRAKQIQQAAKEKGTSARRQVIRTREAKREIEPGELFETWQREARERGITPSIIENLRTQHHKQELERARALARELEQSREGPEPDFYNR
jgi:conjugative relaxase-like TrwC/TraI family protein